MQKQKLEFNSTVDKLNTEIKNPDFVPFKKVTIANPVKLKRTRISRKPLEYIGSGIGSKTSPHFIKNSKTLKKMKLDHLISPQKSFQIQDSKSSNYQRSRDSPLSRDSQSSLEKVEIPEKNGIFFTLKLSVVCCTSYSRYSLFCFSSKNFKTGTKSFSVCSPHWECDSN